MSNETPSKIPTNDEVIEELTKDLESQCIPGEDPKEEIPNKEKQDDIPEDFDKSDSETEATPETIPEDYVDEEALKQLEESLSDEEKEENRRQSLELKTKGNEQFKNSQYLESIKTYTDALKLCPTKFTNDRSIFYSNRAASKVKLQRNKSAIDDCTMSIKLNPNFVKAYLRRAKLYEQSEKLDESLEDWKKILELDPGNHDARAANIRLPPLINERNEKMKTEMMGKLKDLGNIFLKPFGLSTENFQLQKDPNTGGYSVNFQQK